MSAVRARRAEAGAARAKQKKSAPGQLGPSFPWSGAATKGRRRWVEKQPIRRRMIGPGVSEGTRCRLAAPTPKPRCHRFGMDGPWRRRPRSTAATPSVQGRGAPSFLRDAGVAVACERRGGGAIARGAVPPRAARKCAGRALVGRPGARSIRPQRLPAIGRGTAAAGKSRPADDAMPAEVESGQIIRPDSAHASPSICKSDAERFLYPTRHNARQGCGRRRAARHSRCVLVREAAAGV